MHTSKTTKLPTDVALALKEIVISAMPRKIGTIAPMEIVMWIELHEVAKKIHTQSFGSPKEIALSLSVSQELALYTFLMSDKEGAITSLDTVLFDFLKSVDKKIKANVFLTKP